MVGMRVRQCPRCELRFADESELEDHLAADHGVENLGHVFEARLENPGPH